MATQNIYALTDTWNAGGTTFTAIKMDVLDTASAAGSLLLDLQVGGTSRFSVDKAGVSTIGQVNNIGAAFALGAISSSAIQAASNQNIGWSNGSAAIATASDTQLWRDAADTLAQRRGTNAQAFRIYNTFTDASNYERQELTFQSNVTRWFSTAAGTGTIRNMEILRGSTQHWLFNSAGNNFGAHLLASTDNTYDIGASGANRPRNLFMASWLRMAVTTVASLPAAATAGAGARMFVSDALAPTFGSAVAGGGAVTVPVYSTGTAWNVG